MAGPRKVEEPLRAPRASERPDRLHPLRRQGARTRNVWLGLVKGVWTANFFEANAIRETRAIGEVLDELCGEGLGATLGVGSGFCHQVTAGGSRKPSEAARGGGAPAALALPRAPEAPEVVG